ncbi:MAG: hypothetical protein KGI54_06330 [Pseudomonadota bacterium]|nr:hypothetical protein [Pseudomonadota bacterium]
MMPRCIGDYKNTLLNQSESDKKLAKVSVSGFAMLAGFKIEEQKVQHDDA